jgi:hypothetical protein
MSLLNDLRSFNLSSQIWNVEKVGKKSKNIDKNKKITLSLADTKLQSSAFIYKRFSLSINTFLDRYLIIFGGADAYIEKI